MDNIYDAADAACANREAEERATRFLQWAVGQGGNAEDAQALCWLSGIRWDDVKPQRRAA